MNVLVKQFYDLLKVIVEKILSSKCTIHGDNLLLKCDDKECICSLIIHTVFNNFSLQNSFLTKSAMTNSNILETRKRKYTLPSDTTCTSLLLCDLVSTCLKVEQRMIKVLCLRFYADKVIEVLSTQDFPLITATSGSILLCMSFRG